MSKQKIVADPDDIVSINVGGTLIQVRRRVLTQVKGSLLESIFSDDQTVVTDVDTDGNFFIDVSMKLFEPLIDFLRTRMMTKSKSTRFQDSSIDVEYFGGNLCTFRRFVAVADHFGLIDTIYPAMFLDISTLERSHNTLPIEYQKPGVTVGEPGKRARFKLLQPTNLQVRIRSVQIDATEPRQYLGISSLRLDLNIEGGGRASELDCGGYEGRRWMVECDGNKVKVTIWNHEGGMEVVESQSVPVPTPGKTQMNPILDFALFLGVGVFHFSNLKMSY